MQRRAQRGFSLVELMVASALALAITAGLVGVFVGNSRVLTALERSSRQIENGRFVLELLAEELRLAGFYGDVPLARVGLVSASPCALDAAGLGWQLAPLRVPMPVQAIGAGQGAQCLAGRVPGTIAIAIRRLSTVALPPAAVQAPNEYVQVSRCAADPDAYALGSTPAELGLRDTDCSGPAPVRRVIQRTYYVGTCGDCPGDAVPSLERLDLVDGGLQARTLAEGIEALAIDLGVDTNGDGTPEIWQAVPDDEQTPAVDWGNVMAVRLHVLTRAIEPSAGYVDALVYELGLAGSVGPFSDAFRRHVYSVTVRLNNPAGRREG